jgi:serpin B
MRTRLPVLLATTLLAAATTAAGETAKAAPEAAAAPAVEDAEAIAASSNAFAVDLYGRLRDRAPGDNLFFSPLSISTALAMTYAGASGTTATEMSSVLHLPGAGTGQAWDVQRVSTGFGDLAASLRADPESEGHELALANALWGEKNYTFLPDFTNLLEQSYGAGMNRVDFEGDAEGARKTINAWAARETRDRIQNLIPPGALDAETTLVLTNAVYFKGLWARKFDPRATREATFHGLGGDATVPFMHQTTDVGYYADPEVQVLDLPYEGGGVSMTIVLPAEGAGGLGAVEGGLSNGKLGMWIDGLRERHVAIYLPRFTLTWGTFDIRDELVALGMQDAFAPGRADFSGMDGTRTLFLSDVFHKAFVDVNEEGTEAAAATAVVALKAVMPTVFRADRPFLFLIRDGLTGTIVFAGRIVTLPGA